MAKLDVAKRIARKAARKSVDLGEAHFDDILRRDAATWKADGPTAKFHRDFSVLHLAEEAAEKERLANVKKK